MKIRVADHVRTNVVGYLALFVALSGASYAAVATNSIKSKHIKDGQVQEEDLGDAAVTAPKLGQGAVTGGHVVADSLTGDQVAESTLGLVPTADSANTAQSADTADDAETLDGLNNSVFERRSRFIAGGASNNITTNQVVFSVEHGGSTYNVLNDGDTDGTTEVRIQNTNSLDVHVLSPGSTINVDGNSISAQIDAGTPIVIQNSNNISVALMLVCQVDTLLSNDPVNCFAMRRGSPGS